MTTASYGTFYGLGVGPGDPDLLTIKAARILNKVAVVFTAASSKNDYSLAHDIARPHLSAQVKTRRLDFPMTLRGDELNRAWRKNAEDIVAVLAQGQDAAFLTLGDSSTYSTYSYLLPFLAEIAPQAKIVTVPGITSYQLAAASLNMPLLVGRESFTVLSGIETPEKLRNLLKESDNLAILKTYKSFRRLRNLLAEEGLLDKAILFTNLGLPDEKVITDLNSLGDQQPGYFSLMVIKKGGRQN